MQKLLEENGPVYLLFFNNKLKAKLLDARTISSWTWRTTILDTSADPEMTQTDEAEDPIADFPKRQKSQTGVTSWQEFFDEWNKKNNVEIGMEPHTGYGELPQ